DRPGYAAPQPARLLERLSGGFLGRAKLLPVLVDLALELAEKIAPGGQLRLLPLALLGFEARERRLELPFALGEPHPGFGQLHALPGHLILQRAQLLDERPQIALPLRQELAGALQDLAIHPEALGHLERAAPPGNADQERETGFQGLLVE